MATYYVDPVNGSNSNNGLGPDASHASNKPFATIAKLIATSGAMSSGDTAYLAPGVYRENVTVGITSPVAETKIIGDPQNAQGFKTSGGVLVEAAPVIWTAYTTNDVTLPATQCISTAGRNYLTFEYILFIAGSSYGFYCGTTSTNITVRNCAIIGSKVTAALSMVGAADTPLNWTIEKCLIIAFGGSSARAINGNISASVASCDRAVLIRDCILIATQTAVSIAGNLNGGYDIRNCVVIGGSSAVSATGTTTGGTIANTVRNCYLASYNTSLTCSVSETPSVYIEETNNIVVGGRTNVTAGANSVGNEIPPLFYFGWEQIFGFLPRMPFMPMKTSSIIGYGTDSDQESTTDLLGRPKPSGSGYSYNAGVLKAIGPLESHDFAVRETSVKDASDASVKLVGPGDHDLKVAVNASPMTISLKVRYDTNHGTTNKPQAILVANPALGVSTETLTASVGVDTWETLTFTQFTPNAKGVVTIRLNSRAAAGSGLCYFDTANIA